MLTARCPIICYGSGAVSCFTMTEHIILAKIVTGNVKLRSRGWGRGQGQAGGSPVRRKVEARAPWASGQARLRGSVGGGRALVAASA